jgi:hypothetical protein
MTTYTVKWKFKTQPQNEIGILHLDSALDFFHSILDVDADLIDFIFINTSVGERLVSLESY